jgi:predicted nucleic acid-binding protein
MVLIPVFWSRTKRLATRSIRLRKSCFVNVCQNGDDFPLAPQVLAEFVHVLTDQRRFAQPLTMIAALQRAEMWWTASEVTQVFPTNTAINTFVGWMRNHGLGRNRVLDTLLGATYLTAGITSLVTANGRDFRIFGVFNIVEP